MKLKGEAKRPISSDEAKRIFNTISSGFKYLDFNGDNHEFRANEQLVTILKVQANTGLRIGDVLSITPASFTFGHRNVIHKVQEKTGKHMIHELSPEFAKLLQEYIQDKKIQPDARIFAISNSEVRRSLRIVCDYLKLASVGTHSFRKLFGAMFLEHSNNNYRMLQDLYGHTSLSTTQRYIGYLDSELNLACSKINIL